MVRCCRSSALRGELGLLTSHKRQMLKAPITHLVFIDQVLREKLVLAMVC